MGEYFSWINQNKKEYISLSDFEIGNKRYESVSVNNILLFVDYTYEKFKNVSCKFEVARNMVTEEISIFLERIRCGQEDFINEYGIDINNPFAWMFNRKGKSYNYTINYSKGLAYCLDTTKIITSDDNVLDSIEPLPVLLGDGNTMQPGEWMGDFVGVSDLLDTEITLLDKIRVMW